MLARMSIRSPASPSGASPALRVIAALAPPTLCVFAADLGHAFQPALAACIGFLLIGFPPARSRSRWLDAAWLTLAMLPLLALLPMPEGAVPDWRAALAEELGIDLGPSFTPQPAALVAALAPFWTGLAWLWWTTGQQWDALESKVMTRVFVLAIAAIAATVAVWKLTRGGPLPGALAGGNAALLTRNQLATVLAIGASAGITMAFCAQLRRPAAAAFGITASLLCATALAVLGSRAGWLATGAGVAASLAAIGSIRHSRLPLIAAAVLLAGGAATIFLLPGETGERLRGSLGSDSGGGFRFAVQRDALGVVAEQPWTGHGLGNFDGVFPFHRELSQNRFRAEHPESDLLWFAGEAGVLVAVLSLVAAAVLGREWITAAKIEPQRTESAAAACGAAAALLVHGLLDVPAHSMFAWIFAVGLAGPACGAPLRTPVAPLRRAAAWLAAIALVGISTVVWRLLPAEPPRPFANDTPLHEIPDRSAIDMWLQTRPLDWRVVELRAHRAVADGRFDEARRDFELLFRLEPFNPIVVSRALHAWNRARRAPEFSETALELLRRIPPDQHSRQLAELISTAARWPDLALALASCDPPLSWQFHALGIPSDLRQKALVRLSDVLATQNQTATACRIVLYQIAPGLGDPPPPLPDVPGVPKPQSKSPSPPLSWYDVAVLQYLARNEDGAWRILRTYLAVKIPFEP